MKERDASVQRLVQLGLCQPSEIRQAKAEAEKLTTPGSKTMLRQAERLFGAAGESNRMKILLLLSKRTMCVCELEAAMGMPQPTVSHHLGVLEQVNLVKRSKNGRWVFYEVTGSPILDLLKSLVS